MSNENQENNQSNNPKGLQSKRNKVIVLAATGAILLGGGLYSAHLLSNPSTNDVAIESSKEKAPEKNSDLGRVKKAQKATKKAKKNDTKEKSPLQTLDTLNDQLSLDKIVGKKDSPLKNAQKLIDKISASTEDLSDTVQQALGKKKEHVAKEDSKQLVTTDKETPTNKQDKSTLPKEDKPLTNDSEEDNGRIPEKKPDPNDLPTPETGGNNGGGDTPIPNPNPETNPETKPDPVDYSKQIHASREDLTGTKNKAEDLTNKMKGIQEELNQLTAIDSDTQNKADTASKQWTTVEMLVIEYHNLAKEMNALFESDGTINEMNQNIYQTTYNKLSDKVNELKEAQESANKSTDTMNKGVSKAQESLDKLDETKANFDMIKQQKQAVNVQTNQAVNTAVKQAEVAEAVQPEINQAIQANDTMNDQSNAVTNQMASLNQENVQQQIETAQEATHVVNYQEKTQNQAVTDVQADFAKYPAPEKVTEPETTPVQEGETTPTITETTTSDSVEVSIPVSSSSVAVSQETVTPVQATSVSIETPQNEQSN